MNDRLKILFFVLALCGCLWAEARDSVCVVRVGRYDSPFWKTDKTGERSGYAYDFMRRIAANTGWTYEYVDGEWPDLLEMLKEGKIDILDNVSFRQDRSDQMLFSERIMGLEDYFIVALVDHPDIEVGDIPSLNGKRVGVNSGSYEEKLFRDWVANKKLNIQIVPLKLNGSDYMRALNKGEIDAIVASTSLYDFLDSNVVPVTGIGTAPYYFAVNKNRYDLKVQLDYAMEHIHIHNAYYIYDLRDKYLSHSDIVRYLPLRERKWIEKHGKIRIAYRDNYMPFCAKDKNTGLTIGLLRDFIAQTKNAFSNANVELEAVAYPTINAAMEAVLKGEADVAFPNAMSAYDAETMHLLITEPLVISAEMAVMRNNDFFQPNNKLRAAINSKNPNYISLIRNNYPHWEFVHYDSTIEALKGVAAGDADLILLSNYRISIMSGEIEELGLKSIATGLESQHAFTIKEGNGELYSIMNRLSLLPTHTTIHASLANYSEAGKGTSLKRFVKDNIKTVALFLVLFITVILWLLWRALNANKKVRVHIEEISELNTQLEEHQAQLEEVTAEQEAHIEEITSMNNQMESQMAVIKATTQRYFCAYIFDIQSDTFKEVFAIPNMTAVLGKEGKAKATLDIAWRNFVVEEDKPIMQRLHDISKWTEYLRDRDIYSCEYRGVTSGWSRASLYAAKRDENGVVTNVIYTIEIIHEQKRVEEELLLARENAEVANQAKTSFLFNMSHDIRTPMNAIIGFTGLLRKHQDEPEKREDYLDKIEGSSNVLLSIINNVLEMARIEKGTIELVQEPLIAEDVNDSIAAVFQELMKGKGLTFTCTTEVEHHFVYIDPIKLREIIYNILSNAYKYTHQGSVTMSLKEIPSTREGYAMYQTTITDTGIGMSEDFLPHLFDEFSRENNTTDNKIEGTGLGMPIVKRLVELMEGTIEVKSEKGVGTTFVVTLPHKIADEDVVAESNMADIGVVNFEGKRILLAEDNDLNAEIAMELLSEVGFVLDRAEDGKRAVEKLEQADNDYYDVILMDIQMPNMNGYEATKAIRQMADEKKAGIPIIAMTANAFEEDTRQSMEAGMNGHLAKPIDVTELMKTLAFVI